MNRYPFPHAPNSSVSLQIHRVSGLFSVLGFTNLTSYLPFSLDFSFVTKMTIPLLSKAHSDSAACYEIRFQTFFSVVMKHTEPAP